MFLDFAAFVIVPCEWVITCVSVCSPPTLCQLRESMLYDVVSIVSSITPQSVEQSQDCQCWGLESRQFRSKDAEGVTWSAASLWRHSSHCDRCVLSNTYVPLTWQPLGRLWGTQLSSSMMYTRWGRKGHSQQRQWHTLDGAWEPGRAMKAQLYDGHGVPSWWTRHILTTDTPHPCHRHGTPLWWTRHTHTTDMPHSCHRHTAPLWWTWHTHTTDTPHPCHRHSTPAPQTHHSHSTDMALPYDGHGTPAPQERHTLTMDMADPCKRHDAPLWWTWHTLTTDMPQPCHRPALSYDGYSTPAPQTRHTHATDTVLPYDGHGTLRHRHATPLW